MKRGRSAPRPLAPVTTLERLTVRGTAKPSAKKCPALSWEGNGSRRPFSGAVSPKDTVKREYTNKKKNIIADTVFNCFS